MGETGKQRISAVTLVVPDYDSGIAFYVGVLGFELIEDTELGGGKRWVLAAPAGNLGTCLLLAEAEGTTQAGAIGNQTGGRVSFFLTTDDFAKDYAVFRQKGARFLEAPRREPYGTVAVFEDPFGNKWDLIEPASA